MTEFARGGLIVGPDPTPIFTQTMLAQPCGYLLSAEQVREMCPNPNWLAKLNAAYRMNPKAGSDQ